jgi:copper chaperone CopZ
VQRALEGLAGVKKVVMRYEDKAFDVTYDPAKIDPARLCEAVEAVGFEAGVSMLD